MYLNYFTFDLWLPWPFSKIWVIWKYQRPQNMIFLLENECGVKLRTKLSANHFLRQQHLLLRSIFNFCRDMFAWDAFCLQLHTFTAHLADLFWVLCRRYNIVFLSVTYLLPMVVMAICYTLMGKELWGSRSIGELTQRQIDSMNSKKKVSQIYKSFFATFEFRKHFGLKNIFTKSQCREGALSMDCKEIETGGVNGICINQIK